jgi:hypothetical protein
MAARRLILPAIGLSICLSLTYWYLKFNQERTAALVTTTQLATQQAVALEVTAIARSCIKEQSFTLITNVGPIKFLCIVINPNGPKERPLGHMETSS